MIIHSDRSLIGLGIPGELCQGKKATYFLYYREDRRTPAFLTVLDSLDDGGFFIIGSDEKLPCQTHILLPFKGCSYILQKT
jgi:hypothetical protein